MGTGAVVAWAVPAIVPGVGAGAAEPMPSVVVAAPGIAGAAVAVCAEASSWW
ncbi:exported hypothetical protein [Agrobacterium genomosp. 2 str. CFBP 5494]|uniref:Uncharacterized protein n=1 Tax=Agrobacterium genomosp. 2 str. CFBP 5494 TaxID=1183436 RepID=A0A9W5B664_9HYPH|nr:exported hypothetical protein [Agrobacterium genomosp. 2 str. CFBP 5494]